VTLRYEVLKVKYGQTSESDEPMKAKIPGEISTPIGQQNLSKDLSSLNTGLTNGLAQLSTSGSTCVQDNAVVVGEEDRNVETSHTNGMDIFDAATQLSKKETVPENITQEVFRLSAKGERTNGDVEAKVLAGQLCEDILGDASKPLSALAGEKEENKCRLRFLPNMVVMVKDCATVDQTSDMPNKLAGCFGRIQSLSPGESVACVVGEGSSESLVQVADLMPELPEEGDLVASTRPDDVSLVGKLMSVDDADQARVSFSADSPVNAETSSITNSDLSSQPESSNPTFLTLPLDRLCKVVVT